MAQRSGKFRERHKNTVPLEAIHEKILKNLFNIGVKIMNNISRKHTGLTSL
jgi:hypothetical protein